MCNYRFFVFYLGTTFLLDVKERILTIPKFLQLYLTKKLEAFH